MALGERKLLTLDDIQSAPLGRYWVGVANADGVVLPIETTKDFYNLQRDEIRKDRHVRLGAAVRAVSKSGVPIGVDGYYLRDDGLCIITYWEPAD